MAAELLVDRLVTEEEYLSLPETTDRVELVDGEVIVSPSPTDQHQRRIGVLHAALFAWAERHPPAAVRMAPLDVRFGPSRILQPDLLVAVGGIASDAETPLRLVPDVVIEVLSARGRAYDRVTKRALYAEAGVPEYWIVDPQLRRVEVHRVDAAAVVMEDELTSSLLPGFALALDRLW
jgi:Uma2 family endonuclease